MFHFLYLTIFLHKNYRSFHLCIILYISYLQIYFPATRHMPESNPLYNYTHKVCHPVHSPPPEHQPPATLQFLTSSQYLKGILRYIDCYPYMTIRKGIRAGIIIRCIRDFLFNLKEVCPCHICNHFSYFFVLPTSM